MKEVIRANYICEFCNKYYIRKHFAEKHDKACPKNPENKHACFFGSDCANLVKANRLEDPKFHCKTRNVDLYTYRAENSSVMDYMSDDAEKMPFECNSYRCACWTCQRKHEGKAPTHANHLKCSYSS